METLALGLLGTISLGLASWALKSVVEQSKEHAKLEERNKQQDLAINKRVDDHRREVDRQISDIRGESTRQYADLKSAINEVKQGITAVHKRIDEKIKRSEL